MINSVVRHIIKNHSSFIHIYVYSEFHKRNINAQKIVRKIRELYGVNFSGKQFIEFGQTYLDAYLIEKHKISFNDLLVESFEPIIHRFRHLVDEFSN